MNTSETFPADNIITEPVENPRSLSGAVDELSALLEKETSAYAELLETVRGQQRAIIHGKLNELKHTIEAEENLISATRALDNARERIVGIIASEFGLPPQSATLKDIIGKVGPEYESKLSAIRERLLGITKELEQVNLANKQLIKSSMNFINETMWVLLQAENEKKGVYDASGKSGKEVRRRVLVDRIG